MFPCKDGRVSFTLRRALETQRPRNLSVPRAGQANRQARSPQGKRADRRGLRSSWSAAKLRRIESGASRGRRRSIRIGSVSRRLCTWAASGGLVTFESLGHRRGGQSKRKKSSLRRTGAFAGSRPRFWLRACGRSVRLSSAYSSPRRAELVQLLSIIVISAGVRLIFLGRKEPLRIKRLLFPP
jgi:hypothetical protein